MRLLFVSHSLPPDDRPLDNIGGMQRVAIDLHDSLVAHRGAEVRTLLLRSPWSQRHWRTPLFMIRSLREIRRLAENHEIDAVLFSSMVMAALAVPLKRHLAEHGVVSAAIANGLDATTPTWPYPHFIRRVFSSLDIVLPISNATAEACRARGLSDAKCAVVLLGIKLDRFAPPESRPAARDRLVSRVDPGSNPGLILCSVGRLVPRKGVAWFIENVLPSLPDDVHLYVAGEGPDRSRIEDAVASNDLSHRVKLLGAVSEEELQELYHGSDLFIMPNVPIPGDMEGFGLVMLEAGLCGLPVIASRLEGIADVITEDENGHLASTGSVPEFRNAIMRYHDDQEALAAASERAVRHTSGKFGWSGVTDRYIEVLSRAAPHAGSG